MGRELMAGISGLLDPGISGLLDPVAFAACFAGFLDGLDEAGGGVLAIDGSCVIFRPPRRWRSSRRLAARRGRWWARLPFRAAGGDKPDKLVVSLGAAFHRLQLQW
jgi:hypothetical protein